MSSLQSTGVFSKKEANPRDFDWSLVQNEGARFENLVACHLLKWLHFQQDTTGRDIDLQYFRDIDGREIDFVIVLNWEKSVRESLRH